MEGVGVRVTVAAWVDVHIDVVEVPNGVLELVSDPLGDVVALAHGEVFVDDDGE